MIDRKKLQAAVHQCCGLVVQALLVDVCGFHVQAQPDIPRDPWATVMVKNIPWAATESDVSHFFAQAGQVGGRRVLRADAFASAIRRFVHHQLHRKQSQRALLSTVAAAAAVLLAVCQTRPLQACIID